MKIAFHAPRGSFLVPGSGGDPVFTESLIDAFTARGHEVEIVSRVDARDFYRGRLRARRLLAEALSVRHRMRAFAPDAWLVYTPTVTYPDLFGWWLRPGRYVLYAADTGKKERLRRSWRWLYVFAHQRSLARSDGITVIRPASARHLGRAGVPPAKLHVLPPAPRDWGSMPSRERARRRLELPAGNPVVLCMARFPEGLKSGKTEMVLALLEVVAGLPGDALLLLVGDNGPGRARVEDAIATHGLEDRVRFVDPPERRRLLGAISNDHVPWFFAAADVYAYPHPLDRPWLSIVEAQACGRPVVTMRTESSELVIRHGETGLLAADMDEFAAFLSALLSDPERRERMGRAASESFAAHFSMRLHIEMVESLLRGRE